VRGIRQIPDEVHQIRVGKIFVLSRGPDRALLRLIARRMRQRALVILNPCQIARIKPSAALVAFEEVFSLVKRQPLTCCPARSRLVAYRWCLS